MADVEREGLEKIILAGIGAVTKTAETAGELLEDLVKKGELTIEQGKMLNEELKHNIKTGVKEMKESAVSSAVSRFVDGMDKLSSEDIAKIKEKIAQIEEKTTQLKSQKCDDPECNEPECNEPECNEPNSEEGE